MSKVLYNIPDDVLHVYGEFFRYWRLLPYIRARAEGQTKQLLFDVLKGEPLDVGEYPGIADKTPTASGAYTQGSSETATPKISPLGTPMYFPLKLENIEFAVPPIIQVQGRNELVTTKQRGGKGSVKEIISFEDYYVTIRGYIMRPVPSTGSQEAAALDYDDFPVKELRQLINVLKSGKTLEVECEYLSYFDITHLTVETYSFPLVEGILSIIPFSIQAISDKPFELELVNKK